MMFGARPAEDVGLDGLPGPPCTRDHPLFGLREPVPQVKGTTSSIPNSKLVRSRSMVTAYPFARPIYSTRFPRWIANGLRPKPTARSVLRTSHRRPRARREHRVIRIAPLAAGPLLGGPDEQAAGPEPPSQVGHRGRERLVGHRCRGHDCVPLVCSGCGETGTYWPSGHDATVGVAATAARPAAVMTLLVFIAMPSWALAGIGPAESGSVPCTARSPPAGGAGRWPLRTVRSAQG